MLAKLENAKRQFNAKHFKQAKQLIIEIIESNQYDYNYKLLVKLGDISEQSLDFKNAYKYYSDSIRCNPQNPIALIKCANLLHQHLNKPDEAESIYQQCLKIDPKNDQCLFNYALLMETKNNYNKAKQYYLECIKINNKRACIHYHLAKLLSSETYTNNNDYNNNHQQQIEYLLQRAIKLQPNVAAYHHEYAVFLTKLGKYNKANQFYKTALKLINNDVLLLYDYSKFLYNCMNDKIAASKYIEIASKLNENDKLSDIIHQVQKLKCNLMKVSDIHSMSDNDSIRIIIYEFDSIITYWNLWQSIEGNIYNLHDMITEDLIGIFGGYDRINQLRHHFDRILTQNDTKIVILSYNHTDIMIEALKRVKLYQYFSLIIGSDTSPFLQKQNSKIHDIIKLKDDNKIVSPNTILFIDHDINNINNVSTECITYHVQHFNDEPLRGPKFPDFEHIECIVANRKYVHSERNFKQNISLSIINEQLYYGMKREIIRMEEDDSFNDIPSIRWMKRNWKNNKYRASFTKYAKLFRNIVFAERNKSWWTEAQLLQQILTLESNDGVLYCRYAKSLSYLRHRHAADFYYDLALDRNGESYLTLLSYSHHLLAYGQYIEAEKCFKKCLDIHKYRNIVRKSGNLYTGLARTMEHLLQPKQAEYYYKLGIDEPETMQYEPIHFHYGIFLRKYNRLKEAKREFEICISCDPSKARSHYKLSDVLLQLNELEGHEYHLKKALEIDPYLPMARKYWEYHYTEMFCEDALCYNNIDDEKGNGKQTRGIQEEHNCYNVEFDRFWFDLLGIVSNRYNAYYDRFLELNMNDIRYILFDKQIENDLTNKIGVNRLDDMEMIMRNVQFYRAECNKFVKWMKKNNLYEYFFPILQKNGIYTMNSSDYNADNLSVLERMISVNTNDWITKVEQFWTAKEHYTKTICTRSAANQ